ncbi:unnamed protein product [Boreogadus saida]
MGLDLKEMGLDLIEMGLDLIEVGLDLIEVGLDLIEVGLDLIEIGLVEIRMMIILVVLQLGRRADSRQPTDLEERQQPDAINTVPSPIADAGLARNGHPPPLHSPIDDDVQPHLSNSHNTNSSPNDSKPQQQLQPQ